jgi:hypothetical protein
MKFRRYATSRQKVCIRCSAAKAKCDRKTQSCSRCTSKELSCSYTALTPHSPGTALQGPTEDSAPILSRNIDAASRVADSVTPFDYNSSRVMIDAPSTSVGDKLPSIPPGVQHLSQSQLVVSDLSSLGVVPGEQIYDWSTSSFDLYRPIDAEAIRNRWLNVYLPVRGQKPKEYSPSINAFIYRMLKGYAAVVTHKRGVLPFIHASQLRPGSISPPLATCMMLARLCEKPLPGSKDAAIDVLQREMNHLLQEHDNQDERGSLATFQAYLMYNMILFFHLGEALNPALREAMVNLQHLACATSRRGLMCILESQHARSQWESWILTEAKRRTLYTMYLFDGILSTHDGLPAALGTELTGLPAPSGKRLWQAQMRNDWEAAYDMYLADPMYGLRIDELWPIPDGLHDAGISHRRDRVDGWLQGVDEYGTMLYAVTSCTHGG